MKRDSNNKTPAKSNKRKVKPASLYIADSLQTREKKMVKNKLPEAGKLKRRREQILQQGIPERLYRLITSRELEWEIIEEEPLEEGETE